MIARLARAGSANGPARNSTPPRRQTPTNRPSGRRTANFGRTPGGSVPVRT